MMARFAVAQKEGAPGRPVPPVGFEDLAITTRRRPIREILVEYGIAPRKRLGQHFLHDRAVCARIVAAAGVHPGDRVLEIGPGLGALTEPLLAAGARVTAVEVDRRLAAYLRDSLGGDPGFELREADVLSLDPEEIFRPFRTTKDRSGGNMGLGLPVSRRIIRSMGGELRAQNRPEGGALFTLTLPLEGSRKEETIP